ncbi:MAG: methyltransferase [Patescibacteria group bacterium]
MFCTIGLALSAFFPIRFFVPNAIVLAKICFMVGPLLIVWAQITSGKFEEIKRTTGEIRFKRGPYRYLRNPTQLGLVILVLGYAFATSTAMLFLTTCVAYLISNVFYKRHEHILEQKYGESYKEYKSSVRKVL